VDGRKIRRLQRLAQRYVHQHGQETRDIRFDVVGVDLSGPAAATGIDPVLHIENAFLPDGAGYYPSR
jgi:Holliday junction resolvase-like predicted endonuclease